MLYNIDFDITAIIISLFIIFYIFAKKGLKTMSNRVFLILVLSNLAASAADIWSAVMCAFPDTPLWELDIANVLYIGLHNTMTPFMFIYILCLLGEYTRMSNAKRVAVLIPLFVDYLLLILNFFFRFVYYYDENGVYQHGPLFSVLYLVAFGYMFACLFLLIYRRRNITNMKRYSLVFIIAATLVALLIQMYLPYILLELFAQSLGFLGILLSIENEDDIINQITKVYNRYAFLEMTPEKIGKADCAFIVVKLQDLSYYNTTIGVTRTNEYLRLIASRLSKLDRRFSCFDLAGGRFVLIGSGVYAGEREKFKEETYNMFKNPWEHKGLEVQFPALICSDSADTLSSIEELLLTADSPFDGSDTVIVDINDITEKHKRRILIEKLIRDAINQKSFQVYYQPIWDKETGMFHSAEALLRLQTPEYGFISPEEFIPVAELSGQIDEIGAFVFEEVCRFYNAHKLDKLGVEYVEVNLSTVQCMDPGLVDSFDETLRKHGIPSGRINLEITESAAADNRRVLKTNVTSLNKLGFSFSLDDYGTGYSNFSYMFELPFSIIKLDKSILWRAIDPQTGPGPESARVLLSNTIRMMKEMGYHVLVEGVETEEQKHILEELGCDYFQGFFFSKPVPGNVFLEYVRAKNM